MQFVPEGTVCSRETARLIDTSLNYSLSHYVFCVFCGWEVILFKSWDLRFRFSIEKGVNGHVQDVRQCIFDKIKYLVKIRNPLLS